MMNTQETIEVATLPLSDGRQVVLPLSALAEVKQAVVTNEDGSGFGSLVWRGKELSIDSLDAFCGLPAPAADKHTTVGIFRGGKDSAAPFRALAFCGIASHQLIEPYELEPTELPAEGKFAAAGEMNGMVYLVPDLPGMLYSVSPDSSC